MKKIAFLLLILLLCTGVCAQSLENVVSFWAHPIDSEVSNFSITPSKMEKILGDNLYLSEFSGTQKNLRVEKVDSLPKGALASIKPVLDGDKSYIRIAVTAEGLRSPGVIAEVAVYAANIQNYGAPLHWFEAVTNARMGSVTTIEALSELRLLGLAEGQVSYNSIYINYLLENSEDSEKIAKYLSDTHLPKLKTEHKVLEKLAKDEIKKQKAAFETRKVIFDNLDYSEKQFKDLVAKNDRMGAAKLIETYLPWEHMEPVETKYWKEWLEAVRDPAPLEKRMFMYRGLDSGQSFINDAGKAFLLPPVIINNQGTYNRRLRSLTTMLDKFISQNQTHLTSDKSVANAISRSSRISNQLSNHSGVPQGSPHMSFTKSPAIAQAFGSGKVGVFAIDPRLITPNALSGYTNEIELIASLAVFPDESLGIIDASGMTSEDIAKKAQNILQEEFGEVKGAKIFGKEFGVDNPLTQENKFSIESKKDFIEWLSGSTQANCNYHFAH